MLNKQSISFKKLNIYALCFYIMTLFVFVNDIRLVKVSQLAFLIFASITILIILNQRKIKKGKIYLVLSLFLFLAILSSLWAIDTNLAIAKNYTLVQLIILFFLVYNCISDERNINICLKCVLLGGFLMCIYSFYYYGLGNILLSLQYGNRLGTEINQNANTFGYFASLTFTLLIYYAVFERKWTYYFFSILPLIFVITSGSRRSILMIVISLLLIMLLKKGKFDFKNIIYFTIILFLIPPLLDWMQDAQVFNRFTYFLNLVMGEGKVDNSLLTRSQLMSFGWDLFKEKPLLGYGTNQFSALHNMYFGSYLTAHNGYIFVLVNHGLVGFILYYGIFFYVIKELLLIIKEQVTPQTIILFIIILTRLIGDFAFESINDKFSYIFLGVSFAFIDIQKYKLKEIIPQKNKRCLSNE